MKLSQLLEIENCISYIPFTYDPDILCIAYRVEDVVPGCLFICTKGGRTNTHQMVSYIASHGATAILIEETVDCAAPHAVIVKVHSTRRALAFAYSAFSYHPERQLKIFGITGTNGKTSTAVFLEAIFRKAGFPTARIGTLGCYINGKIYSPPDIEARKRLTTMTTPDPDVLYPFLRELVNREVTHVVMEVSSHALALEKVSPILFESAAFTNISPEHLDFHPSFEAYAEEKEKLFTQTRSAVINVDDKFGFELFEKISCPKLSCGILWNADVRATEIECLPLGGSRFLFDTDDAKDILETSCIGTYQIYNALLAAAIAKQAGVRGKDIREGIQAIKAIDGRLELVSAKDDAVRVYIDFAHTEEALRNLLKTARSFVSGKEKLILVFGCGGDRDKSKRAPMGACAAALADFTFITSDNVRNESPTTIISDILKGYIRADSRKIVVDREKAIHQAIEMAKDGDVVLVAGKGHEQYEIRGNQLFPFDERKIIKEALFARKIVHTKEEAII